MNYSLIEKVRELSPLVHHITNYVTVNDCANITIGIGASPIMADAKEEAGEIAKIASAVVLNMGTLNSNTVESMLIAGKAANSKNIPVVFDPVGAGASIYRNETAKKILEEIKVAVIRGNISEIKFLAGISANTKGVDVSKEDANFSEGDKLAKTLSEKLGCIVAITGETDIVADGNDITYIKNGVAMLSNLTGTGCMCSSLIGSFVGASPDKPYEATVNGILSMGIAGELAFEKAGEKGNGSFRSALHDEISKMNKDTLEKRAKVKEGML